jgi:DNA-binding NtrC family response regulator
MSDARVLIVEDALGIARALSRALSLAEGDHFNVEVCSSAEQALLSLQEAP